MATEIGERSPAAMADGRPPETDQNFAERPLNRIAINSRDPN
jgi:hypothetical protein